MSQIVVIYVEGVSNKLAEFLHAMQILTMKTQFDDWNISCFSIEIFAYFKKVIFCLYWLIFIVLFLYLQYRLHYLNFFHCYPKSDVVELIIMLISTCLWKEGITMRVKILVACHGVGEIFFSQAYNKLQHLVRFLDSSEGLKFQIALVSFKLSSYE